MEFPVAGWDGESGVKNRSEEIAAAKYPRIRLLDLHEGSSDSPMDDAIIRHAWSECTPASVGTFSAVGYFFARDVQQHEHVPIGVIDVSWGGTPAETFAARRRLTFHVAASVVRGRKFVPN